MKGTTVHTGKVLGVAALDSVLAPSPGVPREGFSLLEEGRGVELALCGAAEGYREGPDGVLGQSLVSGPSQAEQPRRVTLSLCKGTVGACLGFSHF